MFEVSKERVGKIFGVWLVKDVYKKHVFEYTKYVCECINCKHVVHKVAQVLFKKQKCVNCIKINSVSKDPLRKRYLYLGENDFKDFETFKDWFNSNLDKSKRFPVLSRYDISKPHSSENSFISYPHYFDDRVGEVLYNFKVLEVLDKDKSQTPNCVLECIFCAKKHIRLFNRIRTYMCDCKRINIKESPMYSAWKGMLYRCDDIRNSGYHNYGGRGIKVCKEWYDFLVFKEFCLSNGYAPGLQIDRINNDGNYEPDNCRFVTPKINSRNTRRTVLTQDIVDEIRFGKYKGMTAGQISKYIKAAPKTIRDVQQGKTWL